MTSPAPPPSIVRAFPLETLLHILGFCSPATLAVCCRVSHEWLVLASEPLWTTVRLSRPEQLELLFRSVSAAEQATIPCLPASLASQLSLQRIRHLTITTSSVLRTPLRLRASFTEYLHPDRLVLSYLFYHSTAPAHGLFGPIQPRELVYILPRDFVGKPRSIIRTAHEQLRSRHVVVVIGCLDGPYRPPAIPARPRQDEMRTLFFGPDPLAKGMDRSFPSDEITLRFVLRPLACTDQAKVEAFLSVRYRQGTLKPARYNSRPGSFVVEVPFEEAKLWVEAGLAAIPVESRKLVVVQVRPPGSWGEGLQVSRGQW